jgi:hypothetical protein
VTAALSTRRAILSTVAPFLRFDVVTATVQLAIMGP